MLWIHMVFYKQSKCLIICRRKFQKLVCYIFSLKLLINKDKRTVFLSINSKIRAW
ncbi:hypothetical protein Goshw_013178 [Gossypium schwendimanii]|uniref:Uncharacterized protein n=1 Tax=Gossypium schwendimanii TaxID=34291 RepID=A0A7J9MX60_GOSSC|nr:hypothetical protein [Gossypium schwendimanii]